MGTCPGVVVGAADGTALGAAEASLVGRLFDGGVSDGTARTVGVVTAAALDVVTTAALDVEEVAGAGSAVDALGTVGRPVLASIAGSDGDGDGGVAPRLAVLSIAAPPCAPASVTPLPERSTKYTRSASVAPRLIAAAITTRGRAFRERGASSRAEGGSATVIGGVLGGAASLGTTSDRSRRSVG